MLSTFRLRYDGWLWPVLVVQVVSPLRRFFFLAATDEFEAASGMLVMSGVVLAVLWSVLPRAFELWTDRVRIVLGWHWGWNIPLDTIAEVQPAPGLAAFALWGARFAMSFSTAVRIRRSKGMDIVISPVAPLEFIEAVRRAQIDADSGNRQV